LNIRPGRSYLDCTVGSGGHSQAIIQQGGRLYGLDADPQAIKRATNQLSISCPGADWQLRCLNFNQLGQAAQDWGIKAFSGILLDLGLSSDQLADPKRGFSFQVDAPLDMRTDPNLQVTAADLVNGLNKGELYELFLKLAEEKHSLAIADHLVRARRTRPIRTTLDLVRIISQVVPHRPQGIHPATKVFQALRIVVNDELNNLRSCLKQALKLLEPKGRLAVISFHSLEDRIVKYFIRSEDGLINLTKKPIVPKEAEIKFNPRSRSAKLRLAEKYG